MVDDLTDEQWERLAPLIPFGAPVSVDATQIAVLYQCLDLAGALRWTVA